jgi:membrane-bound lytic murein transglycosylase B
MKYTLRRLSLCAFAAFVFVDAGLAASFDKCVERIRASASKAGIRADIIQAAFRDVRFDEKAVRFSRTQPEYRLAIWDYMAFLVDDVRIADGLRMLKTHEGTLRDVERAYGVDRHILTALWGVESNYGREKGDFFLPQALSSLVCAGRKPRTYMAELFRALRTFQGA